MEWNDYSNFVVSVVELKANTNMSIQTTKNMPCNVELFNGQLKFDFQYSIRLCNWIGRQARECLLVRFTLMMKSNTPYRMNSPFTLSPTRTTFDLCVFQECERCQHVYTSILLELFALKDVPDGTCFSHKIIYLNLP